MPDPDNISRCRGQRRRLIFLFMLLVAVGTAAYPFVQRVIFPEYYWRVRVETLSAEVSLRQSRIHDAQEKIARKK